MQYNDNELIYMIKEDEEALNFLIEKYNIPNPFDENAVKKITKKLEKELIQKKRSDTLW